MLWTHKPQRPQLFICPPIRMLNVNIIGSLPFLKATIELVWRYGDRSIMNNNKKSGSGNARQTFCAHPCVAECLGWDAPIHGKARDWPIVPPSISAVDGYLVVVTCSAHCIDCKRYGLLLYCSMSSCVKEVCQSNHLNSFRSDHLNSDHLLKDFDYPLF